MVGLGHPTFSLRGVHIITSPPFPYLTAHVETIAGPQQKRWSSTTALKSLESLNLRASGKSKANFANIFLQKIDTLLTFS